MRLYTRAHSRDLNGPIFDSISTLLYLTLWVPHHRKCGQA
jgi:hypothetical protein